MISNRKLNEGDFWSSALWLFMILPKYSFIQVPFQIHSENSYLNWTALSVLKFDFNFGGFHKLHKQARGSGGYPNAYATI